MASAAQFYLGIKAVIRDEDGRVLLLRGIEEDPPFWDLPGGRMNFDEIAPDAQRRVDWEASCRLALRREVVEETGLLGTEIGRHLCTTIAPFAMSIGGLILRTYLADVPNLGPITLSHEHDAYGWFAPAEAANRLAPVFPAELCDAIAALDHSL